MKNTKLINLLKTFNAAEIKKFRDFVNSPYFNKNKNIISLYNEIHSFYPEFDPKELNEEILFSKVFGNEEYDYFKLKNIVSDLYNLGLEYLKQQTNVTTTFVPDYNLLTQLRTRNLISYHEKLVSQYEKQFSKTKIKDGFHLFNEYLLVTERHISNILVKPSSITMIQEEFNIFHDYSLLNLLKLYALMLHTSKENKASLDLKMFDDVYNYIQTRHTGSNPIVNIYKYIILLTKSRDEQYYFDLKKEFLENFDSLSLEDAYYAHMYIFGYCMDKFNIDSDRRYIGECYELFAHAYSKNMVSLGELLYPDFINYVKVFMREGDKKLTEKFIEEYKGSLPPEQAENCINFSYAYIAHIKGELTQALALIQKVNFPLTIMKVQVKIMQIQLNYELGYLEETRVLTEYFRKSLQKEEGISQDYKNSILNFLKLTVSLINLQLINDKQKRDIGKSKFHEELVLNQKNHFGIRFWLEDRIKEIK